MDPSDEDIEEILEEDEIDGEGKAFFDKIIPLVYVEMKTLFFTLNYREFRTCKTGGNLIFLWMFFSLTCPYSGLLQSI